MKNGVMGLVVLTLTPFLFAASETEVPNPVAVETLISSDQVELPFRPPVEEDDPARGQRDLSGGEMSYQMQLLQIEVQELRGKVEELVHELSRMRATQEDRYLELDGRLQRLVKQKPEPARLSLPGTGAPVATGVIESGLDEQKLYDTALELIRSRQYDLAITQLQAVIGQYPDGALTPNAYYWLGEVYAAKPDPEYENARQALAQVITFFPEHRKVPDAAFKLGKVYHLMGDCARAREMLTQVVNQQQGKSVAKLAQSYLRQQVGSCQ